MIGAPTPRSIENPSAKDHAELMAALRNANTLAITVATEGATWVDRAREFRGLSKPKFVIASLKKANLLLQKLHGTKNKLENEERAIASAFTTDQLHEVEAESQKLVDVINRLLTIIIDQVERIYNESVILEDGNEYIINGCAVKKTHSTIAVVIKLVLLNSSSTQDERTFNLLNDTVEKIQDTPANSASSPRATARMVLNAGLLLNAGTIDEGSTVNNLFPNTWEIYTPDISLNSISSKVLRYASGEVVVSTLAFKDTAEADQITQDIDVQPDTEAHNFFAENNKEFTITTQQIQTTSTAGTPITELVIIGVEPVDLFIEDGIQTLLDEYKGKILTADLAREICTTLADLTKTAVRKSIKNDFGIANTVPFTASSTDILIRRIARGETTAKDEEKMKANKELHENGAPSRWYELSSVDRRIKRLGQGDDHLTEADQAAIAKQEEKLAAEARGEKQLNPFQKIGRFFGKLMPWLATSRLGKLIPSLFASDRANSKIAAASTKTDELVEKATAGTLTDTEKADNTDITTVPHPEYQPGDEEMIRKPSTYLKGKEFRTERRLAIAAALAALGVVGADRAYNNYRTSSRPNGALAAAGSNNRAAASGQTGTHTSAAPGFDASVTNIYENDLGSTIPRSNTSPEMDAGAPSSLVLIPGASDASPMAPAQHNFPNAPNLIGRNHTPENQVTSTGATTTPQAREATPEPMGTVRQQNNGPAAAEPSSPVTDQQINLIPGTASGDVNGALRAHPDRHSDSRERFVVHGVDQILTLVAPGLTSHQHASVAGSIGHLVDDHITTYLSYHPLAARRFGRIHHGDHGHIDIEEVANRHGSGSHRVLHIQLQRPDRHGTDHTVLDLKIPESTVQNIINQHTSAHTGGAAVQHHAHEHTARDHHPARRITQHVRHLADNGNAPADTTRTASSPSTRTSTARDHQPARRATQHVRRLTGTENTSPNTTGTTPPASPGIAAVVTDHQPARRVTQHVRRLPATGYVASDRGPNNLPAEPAIQQPPVTNPQPQPAVAPSAPTAAPSPLPASATAPYERNVERTVDRFEHLTTYQKEALRDFILRFNEGVPSLHYRGRNLGTIAASLEYNPQGQPVLNIDIIGIPGTSEQTLVRAQIPFMVVRRADGSIDLETDTRAATLPRVEEDNLLSGTHSFRRMIPTLGSVITGDADLMAREGFTPNRDPNHTPESVEEIVNTVSARATGFGIVPTAQTQRSLHLDQQNASIYSTPRVGQYNPMDRALRSVLRQVRFVRYAPAITFPGVNGRPNEIITDAPRITAIQPYETHPETREAIISALMVAIRETLNTRPFAHTPRPVAAPIAPVAPTAPTPPAPAPTTEPERNPSDPLGLGDLGLKADRRVVDDAERDRLLREIDQMFNNPPSQRA